MREIWRRLSHGRRLERGLDEEIRFHINQQITRSASGMTPTKRAGRRSSFWWRRAPQGRTRDESRPALLEDFLHVVATACASSSGPSLRHRRNFDARLGIGAATAAFGVVRQRPAPAAPYHDSDGVVRLHQVERQRTTNQHGVGTELRGLEVRHAQLGAMAQMSAGQSPRDHRRQGHDDAGHRFSREFFDVMGVRRLVGRGFLPEERRVGARRRRGRAIGCRARASTAALDRLTLRVGSTVPSSASCRRASITMAVSSSDGARARSAADLTDRPRLHRRRAHLERSRRRRRPERDGALSQHCSGVAATARGCSTPRSCPCARRSRPRRGRSCCCSSPPRSCSSRSPASTCRTCAGARLDAPRDWRFV